MPDSQRDLVPRNTEVEGISATWGIQSVVHWLSLTVGGDHVARIAPGIVHQLCVEWTIGTTAVTRLTRRRARMQSFQTPHGRETPKHTQPEQSICELMPECAFANPSVRL